MRIFGWAADDAGPGWYRLRVPFGELDKHGHETLVDTRMPDEWLETADVIVGQRVAQPGAVKRWERLAAGVYGHRPMLVFEIDDDLWEVDPSNVPAWKFFKEGGNQLLDNLTKCARLADVCTVSTEPLADVIRKINPNVVVLPNQLPAAAYRTPWTEIPFTVGWTGGASHMLDVVECVDGLRQFMRRHSDARFHNIGTEFPHLRAAVPDGQWRATPWQTDIDAYYRSIDFTVGIAPLRPSVFNQSKSDLKFLEYAARGVVPVMSDAGPYSKVVREAGCGFLINRPHEWATTLRALYATPSIVADEAREARQWAETRSIAKHWQEWEAVYVS